MQHARHRKRAHERARPSQQRVPRQRAKHDEHVPEELVPAEAPELRDRRRHPRPVGERGPAPGGLPEEDAAHECQHVVQRVDGRANHQPSAGGEEGRTGVARERAQRRIKDGVSCGEVDGGSRVLRDVVRAVEHDEFEKQFR